MQDNNRNLPTTNQPTSPFEPTTSQLPSSVPSVSAQPSHSSLPSSSSAPSASSEPTKVGEHGMLLLDIPVVYILSSIYHYSLLIAPN